LEVIDDGWVGAQGLDEHGWQMTCASPKSSWCATLA
jgi:hypothetical protein